MDLELKLGDGCQRAVALTKKSFCFSGVEKGVIKGKKAVFDR